MKNIIYDNEIKYGGNPVITITREQLIGRLDNCIHDLGVYLYDHVFNYGSGIVTLFIVESKDEDTSKVPTATIKYGRIFVTNFLDQHDDYTQSDDCASAILEKIAFVIKHS